MGKEPICDEWSLAGLADHFKKVDDEMKDHKFAWVLGAGASKSSGIPLGGELVDKWLRELAIQHGAAGNQGDLSKNEIEKWTESEAFKSLDIKKPGSGKSDFTWKNRGEFYTQVYDARYRHHADEGFAMLESLMADKDPSPGYSILASILAMKPPRHNAVVTTNFDNLVADALSIYTDAFPFVCGHESLTAFVRVAMRRPLICKIHRDLLLGPQNDTRSLRRLHDAWGAALRSLFEHYTPLFIGYGGNDDTLMDLLESFEPGDIKGRPIWCYYARDPYNEERKRPSRRIRELMAQHHGVIVPVPDFDLLMILLGQQIEVALLDEEITKRADKRQELYRERVTEIDTAEHPIVAEALYDIYDRSGGWWAWEQKAASETDIDKQEIIYQQALKQYPDSHELLGNYATSLHRENRNNDKAEEYYLRALEIAGDDSQILANYAVFLEAKRKDHDKAEAYYIRAIELDREYPTSFSNYAYFLETKRKNYDKAEEFYLRAIEADVEDPRSLSLYADFLATKRKDYDKAEAVHLRAIEANRDDPSSLGYYADFLETIRQDYDEADTYFQRAIENSKESPESLGNYAVFLELKRKDYDKAEEYYIRAINADVSEAARISFFACFIASARGNYELARSLYYHALDVDPDDTDALGNLSELLLSLGELDEASALANKLWTVSNEESDGAATVAAWLKAIMQCVMGTPDDQPIRRLRDRLEQGENSLDWKCDEITANYLRSTLSRRDADFYLEIASAIGDANVKIDFDDLLRKRDAAKKTEAAKSKTANKEATEKKTAKKKGRKS